ncbi:MULTISPECIES: NUDIX hydrolase [Actinoalloteichus]|uniref:NUDIX family protein n=1 Tax=Actinoalloteichus fjordicus TaxID=1612552 RepID=A0AAC9L9M5_9PSEU|nr:MULTISPECIES: CoA pyrophosphatase [Actinoalloteichus]APU12344.1 NUDIX family protein [Actinoalloteichus fjordicus]APU18296.1 NUDIX family protein [Actinoalloteichus sp. GBA129-24]
MTQEGRGRTQSRRGGPLVDPAQGPGWLSRLIASSGRVDPAMLASVPPPSEDSPRPASVLVLFGEDGAGPGTGPDVLLLRRADGLTHHPGQVGFPGGVAEPSDNGPVEVALREAAEEVGVLRQGITPVALLPELYVPRSKFLVTPVLAHWSQPSPVAPVDFGETSAVARVPLGHLADSTNRFQVRHPSGYVGPAFLVPGMLVWGFTAGLLSSLLSLGGWAEPWDATDVRDLADAWREVDAGPTPDGEGVW